MAIFGNLRLEPTVQLDDKTRLDASSSFVSKDEAAITLVEIEPFSGSGFIDVTGTSSRDWYLDWEYTGGVTRTETVSLRITTDGAPITVTTDIDVTNAADDLLFSQDSDLIRHEPDIMSWVVEGRNSYLDIHRRAQSLIIDHFDIQGWRKRDGSKVEKTDLADIQEVKEWSTFAVLKIIMEGRSNSTDDIFHEKALIYDSKMVAKRERVFIGYDFNNNGEIDPNEKNIRFNEITVTKL